MSARRIAVIGSGGAGLATAWLLQDDAAVTVFERSATPGGHAATVTVPTSRGPLPVELGFKYIFPWTYPHLTALMHAVGLPPRENVASMSFRGPDGGATLSVPPATLTQASRLASRGGNLARTLSFAWFMRAGERILREQNWAPSLGDFLRDSWIPKDIATHYLVPVLAAAWGAPLSAMASFPAYDVLRVMKQGKAGMPRFYDVPGGASAYVAAVLADAPRVAVRLNAEVQRLTREGSGWRVVAGDGTDERFDAVVLAAPAEPAAALLAAAGHGLADTVAGFSHFDTHIVVHRDTRLMPPERDAWAMINVSYDGTHAWTTEWAGRALDVNVFRTWLPPGYPLPAGTEAQQHFRHLIVDGQSRHRQQVIEARQGEQGLYLAGMYTCDVDNHESAIASAVSVARLLAPRSPRLRLMDELRRGRLAPRTDSFAQARAW